MIVFAVFMNRYGSRFSKGMESQSLPRTPTVTRWNTTCTEKGVETTPPPTPQPSAEQIIWQTLKDSLLTDTVTAAIMGNMKEESGLCPWRFEGLNPDESRQYYTMHNTAKTMMSSERSFGLCNWCGAILIKYCEWAEAHGYELDSAEAQCLFLIEDINEREPQMMQRFCKYRPDDIVTACEDFRQTYEESHLQKESQWRRATYAKDLYVEHSHDSVDDLLLVIKAPMEFEITERVRRVNEQIYGIN